MATHLEDISYALAQCRDELRYLLRHRVVTDTRGRHILLGISDIIRLNELMNLIEAEENT